MGFTLPHGMGAAGVGSHRSSLLGGGPWMTGYIHRLTGVLQSWETLFPIHHAAPLGRSGISPVDQGILGCRDRGKYLSLPSRGTPGLPRCTPSHQIILGGCSPVGNPFRVPTRGFHHSYFIHMLYLAYITIILLARSKSAAAKIFEIKYI